MQDNDFVGFKFNGVHFTIFPHPSESVDSVIKLAHVSEGDRYTNNLLPQGQDATADVPGGDGTYYFGSNFKYRQFDINFAFDELSESDLRKLRQVFSKRNSLAPLIFDEEPYKYWMVKCQGMPSLRTVCFVKNEELGDVNLIHATDLAAATTSNEWPSYAQIGYRVYKGEGSVSFVAYYPFARCGSNGTGKWGSDYSTAWASNKIYAPTMSQWIGTAGLKETDIYGFSDNNPIYYDKPSNGIIHLFNPGDIEADFSILTSAPVAAGAYLTVTDSSSTASIISLTDGILQALASNEYLLYDSRTELLQGCNSSGELNGKIYNRYITANSTLFKIPVGESTMATSAAVSTNYNIKYDYIYY